MQKKHVMMNDEINSCPQNLSYFMSQIRTQERRLAHPFLEKYYQVWRQESKDIVAWSYPLCDAFRKGVWYGSNRREVDPELIHQWIESVIWESVGRESYNGVVIAETSLRGLPTEMPLFSEEGDYPFDQLQESFLPYLTPVKIHGATKNGEYLLVQGSANIIGFALATHIRQVSVDYREFEHSVHKMISQDKVPLMVKGKFIGSGYSGQPIRVNEAGESFLWIDQGPFQEALGIWEKTVDEVVEFPLMFTPENAVKIAELFQYAPYDWGGRYAGRDCSAMLKDYAAFFGVFLGRNSSVQRENGEPISLQGLSPQEKHLLITQQGVPFFSLLHKKGHVMLYVGVESDRIVIFHQYWRVIARGEEEEISYHGHRCELTYLNIGESSEHRSQLLETTETLTRW